MARRRAKPGDPARDVLTRLIQGEDNGERLTEKELLHNCIFLLNAGHETTTNLIGNGLVALSHHPDQKQRLIAHPDMIKPAVEEMLRYESSNQLGNRMIVEPVEIGGIAMPAGTPVTLCIGAANRDPAAVSRSGKFRHRPHAEPAPGLRHRRASMRGDGAGAAGRRNRDLAVSGAVSRVHARRRAGARRTGEVSRVFECAVSDRLNLSSPAKAGDPVRRGSSIQSLTSLEYWVARSSRAMTAEQTHALILTARFRLSFANLSLPSWPKGAGKAGRRLRPQHRVQWVVRRRTRI